MTYSEADTATLAALGKQEGFSLAETIKLAEFYMGNGGHSLTDTLKLYTTEPQALGWTMVNYNNANPSAQIVPGRAQKIKYALIGGGVLLAVVVAWVIWKKVLKK
jgi:hypothetical protein